jgi:hypothetical protein
MSPALPPLIMAFSTRHAGVSVVNVMINGMRGIAC